MKKIIFAMLFASLSFAAVNNNNNYKIDASKFRKGIDLFFSFKINESLREFSRLKKIDPSDPALYFLTSVIYYYTRLVELQNLTDVIIPLDTVETKFYKNNEKANTLIKKMLAEEPGNDDLKLLLAANYGYKGLFKITYKEFMSAHSDGKDGFELLKEIQINNPNFNDLKFGLGLFNFISGSVPWYIRWLITSGDKETGLAQLEDVAKTSTYKFTRYFAMMFLDSFYFSEYEDSKDKIFLQKRINVLQTFLSEYPDNFIIKIDLAGCYEESNDTAQAANIYNWLINCAAVAGNKLLFNYASLSKSDMYVNEKKYDSAIMLLTKTYNSSSFNDTYKEKSIMKLAYCYKEINNKVKAADLYNELITSSSLKKYVNQAKEALDQL